MSGNVWEWVQDWWHENYSDAPKDGSAWKEKNDNKHVRRGGSWLNPPEILRLSHRDFGDLSRDTIGFRLAQNID
jgi:formylglycine-generating enzyme required for sulfatase activity